MPSEQIINVMVTKADRFASMTTKHQNLRKSLCSVTLRCFKSKQLLTHGAHAAGKKKHFILFFFFVLYPRHCWFFTSPRRCVLFLCYRTYCNDKTRRLNDKYDLMHSFGFRCFHSDVALSSRRTCFATNLNPKFTWRGETHSSVRTLWWLAAGKTMTTRWRDEIDW